MKINAIMAAILASAVSSSTFAMDVSFADEAWDGITVPDGQQCHRFGGENPATPALKVTEIPEGSDSLVLEYSDRDSEKMNHGGHGRMSYTPKSLEGVVQVPSVPGHTFDLPDDFKMIEAQRSPGWDTAGAYMPPCSGGGGHEYYVTVKSVNGDEVTATTMLELGKY